MYIWEVREEVDYEGNLWSVLLKDDSEVLEKVKNIVNKELHEYLDSGERYLRYLLDNNCEKDRVVKARESLGRLNADINYLESIDKIEDYKDIRNGYHTIVVEKIEVI